MFSLGTALAIRTRAIPAIQAAFARPAYSTAHGNDSRLDRDKWRNPSLICHAPGWREDLATVSEASVKADRDAATGIDEMQRKTVDRAAESHRHDSALEVERTHATYARDKVDGPLGNAGVGEFEGVVGNNDLGPDDSTGARIDSKNRRKGGKPGKG